MILLDITTAVRGQVNRSLATQVARRLSQQFRIRRSWPVSVAIVSDAAMRRLNRQYRQRDAVTDVLSFSYGQSGATAPEAVVGEIILCWPQLLRQAAAANVSLDHEFALLLAHGLLHLLGYDHEQSAKDARLFDTTQHTILTQLGFLTRL